MTELEKQLSELVERQAKIIQVLEQKVDWLVRKIYGSSSEKLDPDQLHLTFEEEFAKKPEAASEDAANEAELKLVALPKNKAPHNRSPKLPDNLPVDEEIVIPPEVEADPDAYLKVGEKVTEKLDMQQASFRKKRIVRYVYIKKAADTPSFITTPLAPALIEKSILTPSLLSHILVSKYCDHLPLYRQEQIFSRRYNIHISRSTLCDWVNVGADRLEPLWKLIAHDIRMSPMIQVDETPVDYFNHSGAKQQGYFWVYCSSQGEVLYDWKTSRSHKSLDHVLNVGEERFTGVIQCDGYSGYQTWQNKQKAVYLAGCWVHARRYFFDAKDQHPDAIKALQFIADLYKQEHQFRKWLSKSNHPPEAIAHYRKRYSRPIVRKLYRHLKTIQNRHLPKSKLGKAIRYALNQWQRLGRTLSCGDLDLDNNRAENAVRPLKLGAKNWLFIGRGTAGWRSAVIYTLIENIRSKGKDPYAYLKWVFERIPAMTNQDNLRKLLPKAWLSQQSAISHESQDIAV